MNRARILGLVAVGALVGATNALAAPPSLLVVTPGLNSTGNKMKVTVPSTVSDAVADVAYVRSEHPNGEVHYRMVFWIDPTNLNVPEGNAGTNHIRFMRMTDTSTTAPETGALVRGSFLIGFLTKSPDDHGHHMIFWVRQDGASSTTFNSIANLFIGNEPRKVEVEFTQADTGVQSFKAQSFGANTVTRSNLNLGDADVDRIDFGCVPTGGTSTCAPSTTDAGTTNHYFFDEFESYR